MAGGEGEIRTHGTLAGTTVFETAPIDRSGTSPQGQGPDGSGGRRTLGKLNGWVGARAGPWVEGADFSQGFASEQAGQGPKRTWGALTWGHPRL